MCNEFSVIHRWTIDYQSKLEPKGGYVCLFWNWALALGQDQGKPNGFLEELSLRWNFLGKM
jgi:hypothetical protein